MYGSIPWAGDPDGLGWGKGESYIPSLFPTPLSGQESLGHDFLIIENEPSETMSQINPSFFRLFLLGVLK